MEFSISDIEGEVIDLAFEEQDIFYAYEDKLKRKKKNLKKNKEERNNPKTKNFLDLLDTWIERDQKTIDKMNTDIIESVKNDTLADIFLLIRKKLEEKMTPPTLINCLNILPTLKGKELFLFDENLLFEEIKAELIDSAILEKYGSEEHCSDNAKKITNELRTKFGLPPLSEEDDEDEEN
ncbi:MAG: hypothetical protein KBD00_03260 [Candidatus Peribacteraceae bacterium]|nr:hypothetical protein [Candidatus Peribacteraceae bacterium]